MDILILWIGFIGAWLLFAGPIYQAALELKDQNIERDRFTSLSVEKQRPSGVSALWWFLPPVKVYLEHRHNQQYRQKWLESMPPELIEELLTFQSKTIGWLLVALGGLMLAMKETYELMYEHYEIPVIIFWCIVAVMAFLSILFTVLNISRTEKLKSISKK